MIIPFVLFVIIFFLPGKAKIAVQEIYLLIQVGQVMSHLIHRVTSACKL